MSVAVDRWWSRQNVDLDWWVRFWGCLLQRISEFLLFHYLLSNFLLSARICICYKIIFVYIELILSQFLEMFNILGDSLKLLALLLLELLGALKQLLSPYHHHLGLILCMLDICSSLKLLLTFLLLLLFCLLLLLLKGFLMWENTRRWRVLFGLSSVRRLFLVLMARWWCIRQLDIFEV